MIIAIDTDNLVYIFETLEQAELETEIDTGGGIDEFEYCDHNGQIYIPQLVELNRYKLVNYGNPDKNNLMNIIEKAKEVAGKNLGIKELKDLKKKLLKKYS